MMHDSEKDSVDQSKEQAAAALKEAIATVDTPEKADQVISDLERAAGQASEIEVAAAVPTPADAPAEQKPQLVGSLRRSLD